MVSFVVILAKFSMNKLNQFLIGFVILSLSFISLPTQALAESNQTSYLIITRPMFVDGLSDFIQAKTTQGENVTVMTVEEIMTNYEGRDVPEQIRNYLIDVKVGSPRAQYLLLVGSPTETNFGLQTVTELSKPWEIPIRYVDYVADYNHPKQLIPTDQYYASLNNNWDINSTDWILNFNFRADLYVGRVPVKSVSDLDNWMTKTLNWKAPVAPRHSQFISAYCGVRENPIYSDQLLDNLTHEMIFHYCQTDNGGDITNFANQDNADYVSSYSHGNIDGILKNSNQTGYELIKENGGFAKNPVVFVHGCRVGGLDYGDYSLGQFLIADPAGAVAFVGASRDHWDIRFPFWQSVFLNGNLNTGPALYEAKHQKMTQEFLSLREIDNLFMFNLFGDPQLKVVEPAFTVSNRDAATKTKDLILDGTARRVHTVVTSHIDEVATGHVGQQSEYSTQENNIVLEPGAIASAVTDIYRWQNKGYEAQTIAVGFSACDTGQMACIAAPVKLTPAVNLSLARKNQNNDQNTFTIKSWDSYSKPVTLRLVGKGGQMDASTPWKNQPWQDIAQINVDNFTANEYVNFNFNQTVEDIYLSDAQSTVYYTPFYQVWAEDENGNRLGTATLHNLGEPTVF